MSDRNSKSIWDAAYLIRTVAYLTLLSLTSWRNTRTPRSGCEGALCNTVSDSVHCKTAIQEARLMIVAGQANFIVGAGALQAVALRIPMSGCFYGSSEEVQKRERSTMRQET